MNPPAPHEDAATSEDAWSRGDTEALLHTVERFAREALAPQVAAWDEAASFPRSLYQDAGRIGLLGLGYPEHLGGTPAPWRVRNAVSQCLARRSASGGLLASLFSHQIALPPLLRHGAPDLQAEVIPPVLRGERIAALAITEAGGGSDVASLRCSARREGGDYVIDGEKVFITSGLRADWITVAVRTDPLQRGAAGLSLLLVPGDATGLQRTPLNKMGWHCSDTAQLRFDRVRVPVRQLIGPEHGGFRLIMGNFNGERLAMSAMALGFAEACLDEALAWARERKTFGQALVEHQVIRHKLVDMRMRIASTQAWLDALGDRLDAGDDGPDWVGQVCLLKNHSTQAMQANADAAVQILGGLGYLRGSASERLYREVKIMMIGGGAEEIMKELAARQFGF